MSLKNQIDLQNADNFYETERLIIRPMSLEEGEFIFDLHNRPKFLQYIGDRNIKTIGDAEKLY